ncbi:MAG: DUF2914 domain-containing protein [Pseudomonadota bacterium]
MAEFTEQYVLGLEPKKEAYDVSESDELAIRVFPNGIKTWVFLFKIGEFTRSRTLGIFPDMSPQQARDEVPTARKIATLARDLEKRDEPIGSTTAVIKEEATPRSRFKKGNVLAAGLAAVVALITLLTLIISQHQPATTVVQSNPEVDVDADMLLVETSIRVLPTKPTVSLASLVIDTQERSIDFEPDWLRFDPDPRQIMLVSRNPELQLSQAKRDDAFAQVEEFQVKDPKVKRAQFASNIQDREPVDQLETVQVVWDGTEARYFHYFSEFVGAGGESFSHNWYLENQLQSTVEFRVKSPHRWRVYSKKRIAPGQLGEWRVDITDADGRVLNSESFVLLRERRLANNP